MSLYIIWAISTAELIPIPVVCCNFLIVDDVYGDGYFYDIQIMFIVLWARTIYSLASPETWFCSEW